MPSVSKTYTLTWRLWGYPLRIGATASVAVYTREDYWLNRLTDIWHKIVAAFDYLH